MKLSVKYAAAVLVIALVVTILFLRLTDDPPPRKRPSATTPTTTTTPPVADPREAKRIVVESTANQPITFYGQVVDENGAGLERVSVQCRITKMVLPRENTSPRREEEAVEVTSMADGRFVFENRQGHHLAVGNLQKPGYQTVPRSPNIFQYAMTSDVHRPDPDNPVKFTMFKDRGIPNLGKKHTILRFQWDGQPRRYDLQTGKAGETGNFIITPRRKRYDPVKPYDFDWSADIKAAGGGLIYYGNEPEFLAPKEGYREEISVGRGYSDRSFVSSLSDFTVIVRMDDGRHFLVRVSLGTSRSEDAPSTGTMDIIWNEDGSGLLGIPYGYKAPEK